MPPKFRPLLSDIRAAPPGAEEVISYQMPAYRQIGLPVYFAAFKNHCSLFVAGDQVHSMSSSELKRFEAGKGTLSFTPEDPTPPNLVTRIAKARVAENAARQRR